MLRNTGQLRLKPVKTAKKESLRPNRRRDPCASCVSKANTVPTQLQLWRGSAKVVPQGPLRLKEARPTLVVAVLRCVLVDLHIQSLFIYTYNCTYFSITYRLLSSTICTGAHAYVHTCTYLHMHVHTHMHSLTHTLSQTQNFALSLGLYLTRSLSLFSFFVSLSPLLLSLPRRALLGLLEARALSVY